VLFRSDRVTWYLDTSELTAVAGTYVLAVAPADIRDDAGNPLVAGAGESWLMDPTTATDQGGTGGRDIRLGPPEPNPGRGTLRIPFTLPSGSPVELTVYDVRGRRIATVARGTFAGGTHHAVWDGRCDDGAVAGPGLYLYRLRVGGTVLARRGFLVR
jgi:hypothetical protein